MSAHELRATRETAGLFDYTTRGKVAATGGERVAFLQGMLTSDVVALAEGAAQRSALVTAKAKMIANLLLLKCRESILIETPPARAQIVADTLNKFLITEDAEIVNVSDAWAIFAVQGPRAGDVVRAIVAPHDATIAIPTSNFTLAESDQPEARVIVLAHDRFRTSGFDLWVAAAGAAALRARLLEAGGAFGLVECGADARETLRIAAGRPAWGREATDEYFPGEAGLGSAVSVTKGCYVGQETLSRIHHIGKMHRVLARASIGENAFIAPGTELSLDAKEVGRVTSVAPIAEAGRRAALAIVRRDAAAASATLVAHSPDGAAHEVAIIATID
ncbi:MAG: YgfZ/GcvT domain-containing protein [bacterium]